MRRLADLQIGRAGNGGAGIDQVGGVQLLGAVVALVAACGVKAAVGACSLNIAIRQEAAVGDGIDLLLDNLGDQALFGQLRGEMLCQIVVLLRGGPPEVIEIHAEAAGQLGLNVVHFGAIFGDGLTRLLRGKLGRGAMLIRGADVHHLVPAGTHVAGEYV